MKFSNLVIGGGVAGIFASYFLNAPIIEKDELLSGASGAAGAFIYPKVGLDSEYTRFINSAILQALDFYEKEKITKRSGVLILPKDENDKKRFEKYEKEIKLEFKKIGDGFYFKDAGVVQPSDIKKFAKEVIKEEVFSIFKDNDYWVVNEKYYAKNLILATGIEEVFKIPYLNIRPIWGERIEIRGEFNCKYNYHKDVSIACFGEIMKIGATHKRDCLECKENLEEAYYLIKKAKEIVEIKDYEIVNIKGGFRAASSHYYPIVDKVIDYEKMLKVYPKIKKGIIPKEFFYLDGLYVVNGMGARGFSNGYVCAKILKELIKKDYSPLNGKKLFIKWARRLDAKGN